MLAGKRLIGRRNAGREEGRPGRLSGLLADWLISKAGCEIGRQAGRQGAVSLDCQEFMHILSPGVGKVNEILVMCVGTNIVGRVYIVERGSGVKDKGAT